jgi:hypothetical protein
VLKPALALRRSATVIAWFHQPPQAIQICHFFLMAHRAHIVPPQGLQPRGDTIDRNAANCSQQPASRAAISYWLEV